MKIYFKTLGCKVNQYETEYLRECFQYSGFCECITPDKCDIAVINTCSVTNDSEVKSRNYIRRIIKANPKCKIIVTGCYANRAKAEIEKIDGRIFAVGNVLKNNFAETLHKILADVILHLSPNNNSVVIPECSNRESSVIPECSNRESRKDVSSGSPIKSFGDDSLISHISSFSGRTRAFVKVQDGCNNFCSYCIVPYVRPKLISRPVDEVINEVKALLGNGFKEIVLCGIRLGNYSYNCVNLAGLLKLIEGIEGEFRVRLSSTEMYDITDEIIGIMQKSKKICRHLHLSLQSGSDRILMLMNRRYSIADFTALVEKLKKQMPDIALTTDIIAGFPGETKKDFEDTFKAIKKIGFSRIHVFTYSPRPGTAAFMMKYELDTNEVKNRAKKLKSLGEKCQASFVKSQLNKNQRVLTETSGFGYTDGYIKVKLDNQKPSQFVYGYLKEDKERSLKNFICHSRML